MKGYSIYSRWQKTDRDSGMKAPGENWGAAAYEAVEMMGLYCKSAPYVVLAPYRVNPNGTLSFVEDEAEMEVHFDLLKTIMDEDANYKMPGIVYFPHRRGEFILKSL